jgi:Zn-dependent protease/CBS domain-containing protein
MTTKSQARKTAFGLGGGFPIGRVAGIDIFVHWSWLIVFALLTASLAEGLFLNDYPSWSWEQGWLAGAATSLVVFGCVLVHELSHSIIARRRGLDVSSITLFIFGGVSTLKDEPRGPSEEFVVAAVGPMTSFVLGGLFGLGALVLNGGLGSAASYLAFINVVLGGFNLLPGFPLDGGRVLRAAAWARSHDLLKATRIAAAAGTGVAYLLMVGGVLALGLGGLIGGLWFLVIGWFLLSQSGSAYQQVTARNILRSARVGNVTTLDFHPVSPDARVDFFVSDYILAFHQRAYPVMNEEGLVGIVSLADLRKVPQAEWHQRIVSEIMTPRRDLFTVTRSDDLATAAELMATRGVHQLPVVEGGRLFGLVTRADIVRLIQTRGGLSAVGGPEPITHSNAEQPGGGRDHPYPVRVMSSGSRR